VPGFIEPDLNLELSGGQAGNLLEAMPEGRITDAEFAGECLKVDGLFSVFQDAEKRSLKLMYMGIPFAGLGTTSCVLAFFL